MTDVTHIEAYHKALEEWNVCDELAGSLRVQLDDAVRRQRAAWNQVRTLAGTVEHDEYQAWLKSASLPSPGAGAELLSEQSNVSK